MTNYSRKALKWLKLTNAIHVLQVKYISDLAWQLLTRARSEGKSSNDDTWWSDNYWRRKCHSLCRDFLSLPVPPGHEVKGLRLLSIFYCLCLYLGNSVLYLFWRWNWMRNPSGRGEPSNRSTCYSDNYIRGEFLHFSCFLHINTCCVMAAHSNPNFFFLMECTTLHCGTTQVYQFIAFGGREH